MESFLQKACADHNLSGIGANVFNASTGEVTVYLHWGEGPDSDCSSGHGRSFDEALACAAVEMNERRPRKAV